MFTAILATQIAHSDGPAIRCADDGGDCAGGGVRRPRVRPGDRHPGVEELPFSHIRNTRVQLEILLLILGQEEWIYVLLGKCWTFIKKETSLLFLASAGRYKVSDGRQLHAECCC